MDMRFGTWNIRRLYRMGSLTTISRELSRYRLDLVGLHEVRWDGGGTAPAREYTIFYGKGNESHELDTRFLVHKRIILLVGKLEGKRPLGRLRHGWIYNIKMDLLEIGLSVVDWICLAQDRYRWRALVNSVMNLRVP
jgi:hypothetical protein